MDRQVDRQRQKSNPWVSSAYGRWHKPSIRDMIKDSSTNPTFIPTLVYTTHFFITALFFISQPGHSLLVGFLCYKNNLWNKNATITNYWHSLTLYNMSLDSQTRNCIYRNNLKILWRVAVNDNELKKYLKDRLLI